MEQAVVSRVAAWSLVILCAGAGGSATSNRGSTLTRGMDLLARCELAEAETIFEQLVGQPQAGAMARFYLGKTLMEQGRYKEALKAVENPSGNATVDSRYHQLRGEVQGLRARQSHNPFSKWGLAKKSLKELRAATEMDADNMDARFDLVEYYSRAPGFVGGNEKEALREVAKIKASDPARGHIAAATALKHLGRPEAAIDEYHAALSFEQDQAALYSLGRLYIQMKQFEEAFDCFDRILVIDPDHSRSLFQLGRCSAMSGLRLQDGEAALKEYLTRERCQRWPTRGEARSLLAEIEDLKEGRSLDQ